MEIRDKLNTLEGYKTRIGEFEEYILQREKDIELLEENEKRGNQLYPLPNNQVIHNKIGGNLSDKFSIFLSKFSAGEDIIELRKDLYPIISLMEKFWGKRGYYHYVDMVWTLSIGIMLNIEDEEFLKLVKLAEMDNPNDILLDFLIRSRGFSWKGKSEKFKSKRPYQAIQEIISLAQNDKSKSLERLKKYLTKEWYRGHSDAGWYDTHKHGIIHTGYWSFESGAIVKILGLDDTALKGLPYYPYDMVHWNG